MSILVLFVGCGSDGTGDSPRRIVIDRPTATIEADETPPLYGPTGEVLESEERLAGLVLPRGLERVRQSGRRYVFYSHVPLRKMQLYFGRRLMTGVVERQGDGAIYRDAVPREVRGVAVKLDVAVLPLRSDGTRLVIDELVPEVQNPIGSAQARQDIENAWRYLD